jgi:hypothetical protein
MRKKGKCRGGWEGKESVGEGGENRGQRRVERQEERK